MSVRDWAELCARDEFRAPSANGTGLYHPRSEGRTKPLRKTRQKSVLRESATPRDVTPFVNSTHDRDDPMLQDGVSNSARDFLQPGDTSTLTSTPVSEDHEPKRKGRRAPTREEKEAGIAEKAAQDAAFLESFDMKTSWLPPNTRPGDYTPEFCKELERQYWRNCGLGKPAWYGADMQGTSLHNSMVTSFEICFQGRSLVILTHVGTLDTFLQLCHDSYPARTKVYQVLTLHTSTLACGGQRSLGTSKIWTSSASITFTSVLQNSGTRSHRGGQAH